MNAKKRMCPKDESSGRTPQLVESIRAALKDDNRSDAEPVGGMDKSEPNRYVKVHYYQHAELPEDVRSTAPKSIRVELHAKPKPTRKRIFVCDASSKHLPVPALRLKISEARATDSKTKPKSTTAQRRMILAYLDKALDEMEAWVDDDTLTDAAAAQMEDGNFVPEIEARLDEMKQRAEVFMLAIGAHFARKGSKAA